MVEPSGWHCHPVATEERFTQVNFYFLILTQNNRKVRKINAFLDWDLHHGSELLSASCGFDSRWEHSRKLQAMHNSKAFGLLHRGLAPYSMRVVLVSCLYECSQRE